MHRKIQAAVSDIMSDTDSLTSPDEMSKTEAIYVLEEVIDACRSRIECLRQEITNEGS